MLYNDNCICFFLMVVVENRPHWNLLFNITESLIFKGDFNYHPFGNIDKANNCFSRYRHKTVVKYVSHSGLTCLDINLYKKQKFLHTAILKLKVILLGNNQICNIYFIYFFIYLSIYLFISVIWQFNASWSTKISLKTAWNFHISRALCHQFHRES